MTLTVILCTYNRCEHLAKALDSLASSKLPESVDWEVLVVDNHSNDETPDVVEDFSRRHPGHFRYLLEPQQGKSYALNAGIRDARGEILAFVDDDVTVEPTWLQNITASLRNGECAGVGGRTLPAQNVVLPPWLAPNGPYSMGAMLYAEFDLGDKPRDLDQPPYGTNMAFRRRMFEKYGGFRTDLGPGLGHEIPRFNEDTEFGRRLMAAGERLWYEPSAVVYHVVPLDRIRKNYLLEWWFDFGRSAIRENGRRPDIWGLPRYYFRIPKAIGVTVLRTLQWMLAVNPQRRFFLKTRVWYQAGETVEIYKQSPRTKTVRSENSAAIDYQPPQVAKNE